MFKPGLENFLESYSASRRQNVALVTNHTGRDRHGVHCVDLISNHPQLKLKKIFTPEHGFSSSEPDGEAVNSSHHTQLDIPIISLYGKNKIPNLEDLQDLDFLIYDIQDVGVRFYTYISTLRNILEAAEKLQLPVHILDRPDYLGGSELEGPMLHPDFTSFVGHLPIPLRYAMTPGELGLWWKRIQSLKLEIKVWQCLDYTCPKPFCDLDFPWHKPSPSMPSIETTKFYPGTCLFEGTNISEGRGTQAPFRNIGAPNLNAELWLEALSPILEDNISAKAVKFIPTFSKYSGEVCHGICLSTTDNFVSKSVLLGIKLISTLMQTNPNLLSFTTRASLKYPFFDYLAGIDIIRKKLLKNEKLQTFNDLLVIDSEFKESRNQSLLYPRN